MKFVRKMAKYVALVFFGILFAVFIIEIIGRAFHLVPVPPPDSFYAVRERVGHFPEPYEYFTYSDGWGEFSTYVQYNYRSLRDIDHEYLSAPSIKRIMFLGDSFTAGWQVPIDATYVSQLRNLTDSQLYEFINAGFHGWGTTRQYLYYQVDGHRYDSDVIVLQIYVGNDLIDNGIGVLEDVDLPDGRQFVTYPLEDERSYFLIGADNELVFVEPRKLPPTRADRVGGVRSFLRYNSLTMNLLSSFFESGSSQPEQVSLSALSLDRNQIPIDYFSFVPQSLTDADWQQAWEITIRLIRTLRNEVEASGAQFVALLVDSRWEQSPEGWDSLRTRWQFDESWSSALWGNQFRQFLEADGIPYLDTLMPLREFSERSGNPTIFEHDGHWTAIGHCVIAVEVHNWFIELGIFDQEDVLDTYDICT